MVAKQNWKKIKSPLFNLSGLRFYDREHDDVICKFHKNLWIFHLNAYEIKRSDQLLKWKCHLIQYSHLKNVKSEAKIYKIC